MNGETKVTSGDAAVTNGSSGVVKLDLDSEVAVEPKEEKRDYVRYESYKKVLGEAKSAKERLRAYEEKERIEQEENLKKQGEYEKLLKAREEELAKERARAQTYQSRLETASKYSSFLRNLDGTIAPEFLKLADDFVDQIPMNPDTNEPDETVVKKVASEFKKVYGTIIQKPNKTVGIPSDAAKAESSAITYEEWLKLPKKEMQKRLKDVISTG